MPVIPVSPSGPDRIHELEARLAELEQLDEIKTQFVSLASHELRTPIAVVHGIAATLHLRGHELAVEQLDELRRTLYEQSSRLADLTEQLLDLSRLDAQAIALNPERFRPRERIDELLTRIAPDRRDDVEVGVEPNLEVVTDAHAFERVIVNLLTNALRYGAPPIEVRTRWTEVVDVVVQDHGPGVPDEFVPLLFERFSQAEDVPGRRQGAGLGLAIAKSFANALGGDVRYEPARPSGACFHFELPREFAA
ncbi:MAG TPA: HAMP domain-containing sensor histidine kinase [Gaiellaceae bacterium]